MKTLNKTVLAATIAMLVSPAFAGQIQTGTTGYAAKVVNGQEEVIATTYKVGQLPLASFVEASVKVVPSTDMPVEYQILNQDSVAKVEFDVNKLTSLTKGQIAKLDFLGIPKDAKVLDQVSHDNGDNTLVASTGQGDRTILTFGSNGVVIGSANVDGHDYSISTDPNGSVWMIDNTTSGATYKGLENDTANHVSLGATVAVDPVVTANTKITYAQLAVDSANTIFVAAQKTLDDVVKKLGYPAYITASSYKTAFNNFNNAQGSLYVAKKLLADVTLARDTLVATLARVVPPTIVPVTQPPVITGTPTVRLLVYVARSLTNGTTLVNNLVTVTNQAYVDSGVKMKVAVTRMVLIDDPAPLDETVALNALTTSASAFGNVTADRTAAQADLVTFVHPLKSVQGMCGLGNLNGGSGRPFSKSTVFSVVSYGTDGGYYCNNYTFAHELGHTMGMVHDFEHTPVGLTGHFSDSYGYGLANTYGDIMSYYPVNGVFSTPSKYWRDNSRFPYGVVNKANVARALNATALEISMFHTLTK